MGILAPEPMTTTTYWSAVPAHELEQRDWRDASATHRAVMALFDPDLPGPADQRRATAGILFRIDETPHGRFVLVQSGLAPTRPTPGTLTKDATPALHVPAGLRVQFRVAVNAIQRPGTGGTRCVPVEQISEWVATRLAPSLADVVVLNHRREVRGKGNHALQVDTVDGHATVSEPDKLADLLRTGVGRAKAYGCGLLTVAPLR